MDMLVPLMLVGGVVGFCIIVLMGILEAFYDGWASEAGVRACQPTFPAGTVFGSPPRTPPFWG